MVFCLTTQSHTLKRRGPVQEKKISDEDVKEAFKKAKIVRFSARRFNSIRHRSVAFGYDGSLLPLERVLPLIGVTPQMLRPVFNPQPGLVRRRFPFNLSWFGWNKKQKKTVSIELPKKIESYEELGSFPLAEKPFHELAKIFGKPVEVLREDGQAGGHKLLFTINLHGHVIEHA